MRSRCRYDNMTDTSKVGKKETNPNLVSLDERSRFVPSMGPTKSPIFSSNKNTGSGKEPKTANFSTTKATPIAPNRAQRRHLSFSKRKLNTFQESESEMRRWFHGVVGENSLKKAEEALMLIAEDALSEYYGESRTESNLEALQRYLDFKESSHGDLEWNEVGFSSDGTGIRDSWIKEASNGSFWNSDSSVAFKTPEITNKSKVYDEMLNWTSEYEETLTTYVSKQTDCERGLKDETTALNYSSKMLSLKECSESSSNLDQLLKSFCKETLLNFKVPCDHQEFDTLFRINVDDGLFVSENEEAERSFREALNKKTNPIREHDDDGHDENALFFSNLSDEILKTLNSEERDIQAKTTEFYSNLERNATGLLFGCWESFSTELFFASVWTKYAERRLKSDMEAGWFEKEAFGTKYSELSIPDKNLFKLACVHLLLDTRFDEQHRSEDSFFSTNKETSPSLFVASNKDANYEKVGPRNDTATKRTTSTKGTDKDYPFASLSPDIKEDLRMCFEERVINSMINSAIDEVGDRNKDLFHSLSSIKEEYEYRTKGERTLEPTINPWLSSNNQKSKLGEAPASTIKEAAEEFDREEEVHDFLEEMHSIEESFVKINPPVRNDKSLSVGELYNQVRSSYHFPKNDAGVSRKTQFAYPMQHDPSKDADMQVKQTALFASLLHYDDLKKSVFEAASWQTDSEMMEIFAPSFGKASEAVDAAKSNTQNEAYRKFLMEMFRELESNRPVKGLYYDYAAEEMMDDLDANLNHFEGNPSGVTARASAWKNVNLDLTIPLVAMIEKDMRKNLKLSLGEEVTMKEALNDSLEGKKSMLEEEAKKLGKPSTYSEFDYAHLCNWIDKESDEEREGNFDKKISARDIYNNGVNWLLKRYDSKNKEAMSKMNARMNKLDYDKNEDDVIFRLKLFATAYRGAHFKTRSNYVEKRWIRPMKKFFSEKLKKMKSGIINEAKLTNHYWFLSTGNVFFPLLGVALLAVFVIWMISFVAEWGARTMAVVGGMATAVLGHSASAGNVDLGGVTQESSPTSSPLGLSICSTGQFSNMASVKESIIKDLASNSTSLNDIDYFGGMQPASDSDNGFGHAVVDADAVRCLNECMKDPKSDFFSLIKDKTEVEAIATKFAATGLMIDPEDSERNTAERVVETYNNAGYLTKTRVTKALSDLVKMWSNAFPVNRFKTTQEKESTMEETMIFEALCRNAEEKEDAYADRKGFSFSDLFTNTVIPPKAFSSQKSQFMRGANSNKFYYRASAHATSAVSNLLKRAESSRLALCMKLVTCLAVLREGVPYSLWTSVLAQGADEGGKWACKKLDRFLGRRTETLEYKEEETGLYSTVSTMTRLMANSALKLAFFPFKYMTLITAMSALWTQLAVSSALIPDWLYRNEIKVGPEDWLPAAFVGGFNGSVMLYSLYITISEVIEITRVSSEGAKAQTATDWFSKLWVNLGKLPASAETLFKSSRVSQLLTVFGTTLCYGNTWLAKNYNATLLERDAGGMTTMREGNGLPVRHTPSSVLAGEQAENLFSESSWWSVYPWLAGSWMLLPGVFLLLETTSAAYLTNVKIKERRLKEIEETNKDTSKLQLNVSSIFTDAKGMEDVFQKLRILKNKIDTRSSAAGTTSRPLDPKEKKEDSDYLELRKKVRLILRGEKGKANTLSSLFAFFGFVLFTSKLYEFLFDYTAYSPLNVEDLSEALQGVSHLDREKGSKLLTDAGRLITDQTVVKQVEYAKIKYLLQKCSGYMYSPGTEAWLNTTGITSWLLAKPAAFLEAISSVPFGLFGGLGAAYYAWDAYRSWNACGLVNKWMRYAEATAYDFYMKSSELDAELWKRRINMENQRKRSERENRWKNLDYSVKERRNG